MKPAPSSTTAAGRGNAAIAPGSSAAQVAKRGGEVWHVIAFTFRREADAEKRARSINEKYSNLHAQVFTPSGGPPYLVALGGRMSREEAEVMRRKARAEGLPRDTYVRNYTR